MMVLVKSTNTHISVRMTDKKEATKFYLDKKGEVCVRMVFRVRK